MTHIPKKIDLATSAVVGIDNHDAVANKNQEFSMPVAYIGSDHKMIAFQWEIDEATRSVDLQDATVTKATLEFWHYNADGPDRIDSVRLVNLTDLVDRPTGASATKALISTEILTDGKDLNIISLSGEDRTKVSVDITDTDFLDDIESALTSIDLDDDSIPFIALGLKKELTTSEGVVDVGGQSLIFNEGEGWTEATASDLQDPPKLILSIEKASEAHTTHVMRYTTSDPTSNQSTPSNSIGGHQSLNTVYIRAEIGDFLGSTQTTIPIHTASDISQAPTSGLAQVGPEVIQYTSISSSTLLGVTRGISPPASFPSSLEPAPEYIRFLEINNLFDNLPAEGEIQYRCIAILNSSAFTAFDTQVFVRQDTLTDAQIDIGIEIPAFDTISGTHTGAAGNAIEDSTTFANLNIAIGTYDGSAVILNEDTTKISIIDHFDITDGVATITFASTGMSVANGDTYRIFPAPSQRTTNDITAPTANNNLFLGFLADGATNKVVLNDHGSEMRQNDLFYLWIKKTLTSNVEASLDTGAIIMIRFTEG